MGTEETLVQCGACDAEGFVLVRIGQESARMVCEVCGTVGTYPLDWEWHEISPDWQEVREVIMWARVETATGWRGRPDHPRVTDNRDIAAMWAGV